MTSKNGKDPLQWLEDALATDAVAFPNAAEEVHADADFCVNASAEDCCRRIVGLARPGIRPEETTCLDVAGRYLARLFILRELHRRG
jgi:hypothetical protein